MTEEVLFHAVLSRPAADRAAYLAAHCPDPDLRRRVEGLLAAHDRPAGRTRRPATGAYARRRPAAGRGRHRLRRPVQAAREARRRRHGHGLRRRPDRAGAAPGRPQGHQGRRSTRSRLLARFEQERQALALMDHPNIAKVLDAGIDRAGTAVLRRWSWSRACRSPSTATRPSSRPGSGWNCSFPSARPCSTPIRRASSTAT